jgi:hypothetical protein
MVRSDVMTNIPAAVANPPQFTESYWAKVGRVTRTIHIHKVNDFPDNGEKEFLTREGITFRRKREEITQLIFPGTVAELEVVQTGDGELVTGLFLPDVKAWVFRMTAADLAAYTKQIMATVQDHRRQVREQMVEAAAVAVLHEFNSLFDGSINMATARLLADAAIKALETGRSPVG